MYFLRIEVHNDSDAYVSDVTEIVSSSVIGACSKVSLKVYGGLVSHHSCWRHYWIESVILISDMPKNHDVPHF